MAHVTWKQSFWSKPFSVNTWANLVPILTPQSSEMIITSTRGQTPEKSVCVLAREQTKAYHAYLIEKQDQLGIHLLLIHDPGR